MRYLRLGVLCLAVLVSAELGGQEKKKKRVELPAAGWGSLAGKVTLHAKDDIPTPASLVGVMKAHPDKDCCLAGKDFEKIEHRWLVDKKTRGVANVLIWLRPPVGYYFPIHEKYKKRADHVVIDQPHCMFLPHVAAHNPSYFDGKEIIDTGQKLIIKNSAVSAHNVNIIGQMFNRLIVPKGELQAEVEPARLPLTLQCNIHSWMSARLLVSDHPYYAITREDGSYEMPIAPVGAELIIVGWHEERGYVLENYEVKRTLNAGKNTFDFEVKLSK